MQLFAKDRPVLNPQVRKKSRMHLEMQQQIQALFPDAEMEKSFPQIARIADVAIEMEKIIFEIQCSAISLEEVKSRCLDYESLGYQTIWILYDRRFNKKNLSPSEFFLKQKICYYFNKEKILYDQFEVLTHRKRIFHGRPLTIDLKKIKKWPSSHPNMPRILIQRSTKWLWYHEGDLMDRFLKGNFPSFFFEMEKKFSSLPKKESFSLKNFYLKFFHSILEIVVE